MRRRDPEPHARNCRAAYRRLAMTDQKGLTLLKFSRRPKLGLGPITTNIKDKSTGAMDPR